MPPPAATQVATRLWTARPELHTDPLATKLTECMTPPAGSVRRFTRGRVRELKNGHNSITVQNRTYVYINFFHHKDLGNHLLQLCPKVVKHPVFASICSIHKDQLHTNFCLKNMLQGHLRCCSLMPFYDFNSLTTTKHILSYKRTQHKKIYFHWCVPCFFWVTHTICS